MALLRDRVLVLTVNVFTVSVSVVTNQLCV